MYQVYYFTRTGNSRRIAEKIAGELSCDIFRITDDVNWNGIGAYLKFMKYADGKKPLKICCDGDPSAADEIIVVSPVWGSHIVPAVKQFIEPVDKGRMHLVTSSGAGEVREKEGFASVTCIIKKKKNEETAVRELLNALQ